MVYAHDSKSCLARDEGSSPSPGTMKKYPVIVALDGLTLKESLRIAKELGPYVWGFKVHDLLIREGFAVIPKIKKFGNIFVDLKLHDIPTTVQNEVTALIAHGADLVSVHASGGRDMLMAAQKAGGRHIAAVTQLSSLPGDTRKMLHRASLARAAGISILICPARDVSVVRRIAKSAVLITPGIRALRADQHDQRRTASALAALAAGATLLVIGRPITESATPLAVLHALFKGAP